VSLPRLRVFLSTLGSPPGEALNKCAKPGSVFRWSHG
jgi:hypothetical protein